MYRVHAPPSEEKLEALRGFLSSLGISLAPGDQLHPRDFDRVLRRYAGTPELQLISEVMLRSQSQAAYSPDNIGHFGLALPRYAHFTSPIRRYADLLVHRALIKALRLGHDGISDEQIANFPEIGERITETERRAQQAEREAIDRYLTAFMAARIGGRFAARISGVTRFGLFVAVTETGASGIVPFATLPDDYWQYDEREQTVTGRHTQKGLSPGAGSGRAVVRSQPGNRGHGVPCPGQRSARAERSGGETAPPPVMRIGVLLVLFVIGRGQADTLTGGGFDQDRLIAVYSEALTFIAPRILDPVPVPLLTVWGLQGLTALDPSLRVVATDARLQLVRQGEILLDIQAPKDDASDSWAKAAVALTAASLPVSAPVRRAGTQGIIEGFFNQLFSRLDPYSRYVPPVEAGEDRARRAGRAGLGLTLGQKNAGQPSGGQKTRGHVRASERGTLIEVLSVVRDSPAAIAGIRPNDILIAVDGQQTLDQDPATIAALLAGAEGSVVTVSWRGRDGRTREAQLVRVMVPPETVFAQRSDDVLVLRVSSFSNSTASHIALSVQDALSEPHPVDGIVLDLRDNRGGLLRQAVTAADTFLPAGLVATTVGRDPDSKNVWRSAEGELAENVPVIVLVDGRTASAAEILAAALADRGRAVVVGSDTVGKGMVQTIDPLPDGGELFVTWSQTLAPLGWPIQGLGVLPQVCTSLGQEALNRQLASLSTGFQPMAAAIRRSRAARIPVPASEVLEIRAPCPASEGRPSDLEAARLLIANPAAYAAALLPPMADRQSFGQPNQGAAERP